MSRTVKIGPEMPGLEIARADDGTGPVSPEAPASPVTKRPKREYVLRMASGRELKVTES